MSTALITGASKGIGKAIAEILASKKINLLLVARSESLLKEHAYYLHSKFNVEVNYLVLDLSQTNAVEIIFDWCKNEKKEINILVNNAGYGLSGPFEKYSIEDHFEMMKVNMNVPVQLVYTFLPMLRRQTKSYILNIASTAAYQSVPGLNVYAATKAFILNFSRGLRYELRKSSISVTVISPGATDTDFPNRASITGENAIKVAEKFNMQPKAVAAIAVKAMFDEKAEVVAGILNKLTAFFVWLLPKQIAEKAAANIYDL
ncbi:NADP-dependent 3-hydroxy acid dehydrogenase YdfG [mine drainage metagenome]|uniref:NADP-dependent 3-hydroxy acid dehydrogenase YdfG n=1 Tax=mine drainage metagenome TaxID=410659 RepID=A0A1J5RXS0_9ZZZZ